MTRWTQSFFQKDTIDLAEALLGQILVRRTSSGAVYKGIIVETEAYLGLEDPACHSFGGHRTPRTENLYQPPGFSYVYLIYGMYDCFNIVSMDTESPEAVLIRAVEPISPLSELLMNRRNKNPKQVTNGPGKLCEAFQISREQNGLPLFDSQADIYIEPGVNPMKTQVNSCGRIGVEYSGDALHWPLRFYIQGNPFVSILNHD